MNDDMKCNPNPNPTITLRIKNGNYWKWKSKMEINWKSKYLHERTCNIGVQTGLN